MKTTDAQSRSTASGCYVLPLNLERRYEATVRSGLVGAGGGSMKIPKRKIKIRFPKWTQQTGVRDKPMKTKSVKTLVATLKRFNAAYKRLTVKRDKVPMYDRLKVWPTFQREADMLCGNIMHTERCIINALLRE